MNAALHRFAVFLSGATFVLVFVGGLVTSTGSGLAVPDWPLSFGMVFPKMEGGVLFEHGHRMVAAAVGALVVALYVWTALGKRRAPISTLAACALGTVVLQGLLGGLTVLLKLPPAVSVAHACLAQAFLCLTISIAVVTGDVWGKMRATPERAAIPLKALAIATTAAVYVQLILGAVMRHTGAGLAIPDFPLAFGRLVPPLGDPKVQIHFAHRVGALIVSAMVVWTVSRILREHAGEGLLRRPAILLATLLVAQGTLGALTIWTGKAVLPTTAHVLGGAAILGTSFLITLRAHRLVATRPLPVKSAATFEVTA